MEKVSALIASLASLLAIAFGFGVQSSRLGRVRQDTDNIGRLHRETINNLADIRMSVSNLQKDIEYLKAKIEKL